MLNFKHLPYILAVAKVGTVNRAAKKLHLTPQTLSGQLSQFEEWMEVSPSAPLPAPPTQRWKDNTV